MIDRRKFLGIAAAAGAAALVLSITAVAPAQQVQPDTAPLTEAQTAGVRRLVLQRVALGSLVLACGGAMEPIADTGAGSASLVALPPMHVARFAHTATSLPDGRVLVAGGSGSDVSTTAELFDPGTRRFIPTQGLLRPRGGHTATSLPDGRVLITGGSDERDDRGQYRDAEIYDPQSERFSGAGELRRARYKHQGTMTPLVDGRILIAGGIGPRFAAIR